MNVGSENLLQVIKFDSPLEQGWKLKEGHRQVQFLPCEDSGYGTRIEAEQDFCMEYRVGVLQQKCKAIGFFVRSESDFAFYAKIRVHNQLGEVLQDPITLYCHPGEGSYPEQHPQYPNEYEVHVPVKRLKSGWFLWMIDLPCQTWKAARVKGKEWEFDRLLWLELKGYGVKIDADRIELYKESPWKRQIFLCYAQEDEEKANHLYQELFDAGFKPWMDKKDILPGEQWEFCIPRAIRRSDFFLACLSANSVTKRGYLQKEIKEALDIWDEMLEDDIYLIPVRLEDCEVPERLHDFQWVNLFEEDGWTRLVKAIRIGVKRREVLKPNVQESTPFESHPAHEKPSHGTEVATPEEGPERVPKGQPVDQEEVRHIEDQLSIHRRNLRDLEIRKAQKSIDVDVKTLREIEYAQKEIAQLERRLKLCEIRTAGNLLIDSAQDRKVRERAARQLGRHDDELYKQESFSRLLKGIEHELSTVGDGVVQMAIAEALAKVSDSPARGRDAIRALRQLLEREERKTDTFYEPACDTLRNVIDKLVNQYGEGQDEI
jgi:hypothetical protein